MLHVVRWSPRGLTYGAGIRLGTFLLVASSMVGCSFKPADKGSRVSLVLPNPQSYSLREGGGGRVGLAPSAWNSVDFKCYGVNVVGPGIADSSANPDPTSHDLGALVAGTKSCAYRGITSHGFTFAAGSNDVTIDLQVPAGAGRVIQLVGITNADHCGANFLTNAAPGSPGAYEIGRKVVDLFGDATVSIPVTYSPSEDRRVDCGGSSSPATTLALTLSAPPYVYSMNQTAVSFSGTCSVPGSTVDLKFNGTLEGSTACAANGTWTRGFDLSNAANYPDGAPILVEAETTHNGATVEATDIMLPKDVSPPTTASVTIESGAGTISNLAVSLTLSAVGATQVKISNNPTLSGATAEVYATAKTWTLANPNASNTVYVGFLDAAGNQVIANDSVVHDNTAPIAATALGWAQVSPTNATGLTASWTKSASPDLSTQKIQFYADAGCGSASGGLIDLASSTLQTYAFTAPGSGSFAYKIQSFDAAGQSTISPCSSPIVVDVVAPTVAISTPANGSYINSLIVANVAVTGTCSENGRNVEISGNATASVACTANVWTANLNFSAAADGAVSITVNHSDVAGNTAGAATRNFVRDTSAPTVAIVTPAGGAYINASNQGAFNVSGTCSENGRNVVISGAAAGTTTCASGAWSVGLAFNAAGDGNVTITVDHNDVAGNAAVSASRSFTKDATPPSIGLAGYPSNGQVFAGEILPLNITVIEANPGANLMSVEFSPDQGNNYSFLTNSLSPTNQIYNWPISGITVNNDARIKASLVDAAGNLTFAITNGFTVVGPPTEAIVAPGGPSSAFAGQCVGHPPSVFRLAVRDAMGRPARPISNLNFTLNTNYPGNFYPDTDPNCASTPNSVVTIGPGASERGFYFKPIPASGGSTSYSLTLSPPGGVTAGGAHGLTVTHAGSWTTAGAPIDVFQSAGSVWADGKFYSFNGYQSAGVGKVYDPAGGWSAMDTLPGAYTTVGGAFEGDLSDGMTAVWTGTDIIFWGGFSTYFGATSNKGAVYRPSNAPGARWVRQIALAGAPSARTGHRAVWAGTKMFVWGGVTTNGNNATATNTGALYDPSTDTWTPVQTSGAPAARSGQFAAEWTGSKVIVWGGQGASVGLNTGGLYDPVGDSWTSTIVNGNTPTARAMTHAAWTGSHLIVWGGESMSVSGGGAMYDPVGDGWDPLPTVNQPAARQGASVYWHAAHQRLFIWGGYNGTSLASGGIFDVPMQKWIPMSVYSAPAGAYNAPVFFEPGSGSLNFFGGTNHHGTTQNIQRYILPAP